MRGLLGVNVFDAAVARVRQLYDQGHRVLVSFSGGKDSTVLLGVAALAARAEGRLPVEAVMRDNEVMMPGTFEYAGRVARRRDVAFAWHWAVQPIDNVLDGGCWWTFDPDYKGRWLRKPPRGAVCRPSLFLRELASTEYFPPPAGRETVVLIGCRAEESPERNFGVHAMRGHLARRLNRGGSRNCWPIYDWQEGDVWKAIKENRWDYNSAYTDMIRAGWPRAGMRVAEPTINAGAARSLARGRHVWPDWFAAVADRIDGVKGLTTRWRPAENPGRQTALCLAAAEYSEGWAPLRGAAP
jgi:predicted phosphoadenosine phosphosulfate sulfurtransferase